MPDIQSRFDIRGEQVFRRKDLIDAGYPQKSFESLVRRRVIQQMGSGFYADPGLSPFQARVLIVAKYYPHAVISGWSALRVFGVLETDPGEVTIEVSNTTSLKNQLLMVRRVDSKKLNDAKKVRFLGGEVKVHGLEKTFCDLSLQLGGKFAPVFPALKNAIERNLINVDLLIRLDIRMRAGIAPFLDLLSSGEQVIVRHVASPKEMDPTRKTILDTAFELYASRGVEGIGIRDVARECGVSTSTVVRHFKNRRGLKKAVLDELKRILMSQVIRFPKTDDPVLFTQEFFRSFFEEQETSETMVRAQLWTLAEGNQMFRDIVNSIGARIVLHFTDLIRRQVGCSLKEAKVRATLLSAYCDHYKLFRWIYMDMLEIGLSRKELLKGYQNYFINVMVPQFFSSQATNLKNLNFDQNRLRIDKTFPGSVHGSV